MDNETKPQDGDGKLPASFMFGPQFTEQNIYQLCSKEVHLQLTIVQGF
jgi:hypothetical protein